MTGVLAVPERRYTLGLVYKANTLDAHREFMTAEDLEEAAWDYATTSREVGIFHADGTGGSGTVVESYIYRGPDWLITSAADGSTVLIKAGDWLMGVLWSLGAWALIKSGRINGLSMQGLAIHREVANALEANQ
jgi:hypothetical protein